MRISLFACIWSCAAFLALQRPVLLSNKLLLIILVLVLTATYFTRIKFPHFTCICWIFALSFSWSTLYAKQQLNHWLPHSLENTPLSVEIVIDDMIHQSNNSCLLIVKIIKGQWLGKASIYVNEKLFLQKYFQVGQIWSWTVKLKRPHGLANPYLFRTEIFYLESRVNAVGTLLEKFPIKLLSSRKTVIQSTRYFIQGKISTFLNHSLQANLISALTVGHLQNFKWEEKQILQKTGTSHLLAISGLHIGLVAMVVYFIAKIIWRQFTPFLLYLPLPKFAAFVSMSIVLLYSLLSGFSLPTQRACIMLIIILSSRFLGRCLPKWHGFSLALFLILMFDPFAILTSSFWLSFIAVIIIFMISDNQISSVKWLNHLKWQVLLSISLIPWTVYFFQSFSLVSILANLIAVPWIGYVVIPGSLLGVIFLFINENIAKYILQFCDYNLKFIWRGLDILADINWSQWQLPHVSFIVFIISVTSCLILCCQSLGHKRFFTIFGLIPLFLLTSIHPKQNQLYLYILDVGQGLSIFVQTEKHSLLYDAGLKIQDGFDAGKTIVMPFLKQIGVNTIDKVVISHADIDHSGGIKFISQYFLIKELLSSSHKQFISTKETRWCFNGERWSWDGIDFEFLHPNLIFLASENNGSCVLKITNKNISILLSGDIEHDAENFLVQHYSQKLSSQILIAPHHGSRTSSTVSFLNAVKPNYVIISSGYLNRFHFPNKDVVARYKNLNTKIFNTASDGAITIKIDEQGIRDITSERTKHRKFWDD